MVERGRRAWTADYDADDLDASDFDVHSHGQSVRGAHLVRGSGGQRGQFGRLEEWIFRVRAKLGTKDTLDLVALDDAGLLIEIDRG